MKYEKVTINTLPSNQLYDTFKICNSNGDVILILVLDSFNLDYNTYYSLIKTYSAVFSYMNISEELIQSCDNIYYLTPTLRNYIRLEDVEHVINLKLFKHKPIYEI